MRSSYYRYLRKAEVSSSPEERRVAILSLLSDEQSRTLADVRKALGLRSHEASYAYSILLGLERREEVERHYRERRAYWKLKVKGERTGN